MTTMPNKPAAPNPAIALRVYPGRASIGVSLRAQGRDAELKSLDAWQMKGIYE